MADRVDATITIGGPAPRNRLEDLLDAIESERLGPDWEERFASREDLLAYLADAAEGATFYAREVAGGELDTLQALCVEIGLSYILTYDGYGCEWGPARRIRRPGDPGAGLTCSLNADGGSACVTADDIRHLQLADVDAVLQHLALFDDPHVPPIEIEGGATTPEAATSAARQFWAFSSDLRSWLVRVDLSRGFDLVGPWRRSVDALVVGAPVKPELGPLDGHLENPDNTDYTDFWSDKSMASQSVTSAEFQKGFGRYREAALKEPLTITNHGRESLVLISAEEYRRLKRRERRVMGLDDFTDADVAAVAASEPPPEAAAFDDEHDG
jgi:prevent-host-death family protein